MAICLPGMESKANRADTSATRPEPLVITTKLIMVITIKITIPTAKLPPIKNTPNASMTLPAASVPLWPSIRTIRVEATLRERRSKVVSSRKVGKATKSLKLLILIAVNSTMMERAILKVNSTSSNSAGSGTNIMTSTNKTRIGMALWAEGLGSMAVSKPKIFMFFACLP